MTTENTENTELCERDLTKTIIGAAITVHRELGPGLLESAYLACLSAELADQGIQFRREVPLAVRYKRRVVDCGYKLDFVVENRVVLELKSVSALTELHTAQLLSYLRLSGLKVGLLMNFNVVKMKDGIKRLAH